MDNVVIMHLNNPKFTEFFFFFFFVIVVIRDDQWKTLVVLQSIIKDFCLFKSI